MSAPKKSTRRSTTRNGQRKIWYPSDARLRTSAAAKRAAAIAEISSRTTVMDDAWDELAVFKALHTCAYRAVRRPRSHRVDPAEQTLWLLRRGAIRSSLVENNRGLVYLGVSRFRSTYLERDDLCSEGLFALLRAVDWFNPWRGVRFSTYAYNAITRALARLSRRAVRHRRLFPITYDAPGEKPMRDDRWGDLYVDRLRRTLHDNVGELTDRELEIIDHRYPLDERPHLTLEQVGNVCGLSKERVRQIQNRALRKLRDVLETDPVLQ